MTKLAERFSIITRSRAFTLKNCALFMVWFLLVSFLVAHHVFWRDEERGLALALYGDNMVQMLQHVRGYGHPPLWHLLLRGLHFFYDSPKVLPILALVVATAAVILLIFSSGLSWPFLPLIIISDFFVYEYSVMARNYGISMLILFLYAVVYQRMRPGLVQALVMAVLLFLLANTNVHSVVLAFSLLIFSFFELVRTRQLKLSQPFAELCLMAVFALIGVILCFLAVYPPRDDAAVPPAASSLLLTLLSAVLLPGKEFHSAFPILNMLPLPIWSVLASLLLFGSTLAVIRSLSAWLAAMVSLVGLSLLFAVVYPGSYRHEALWLAFMVAIVWIESLRRSDWTYNGWFARFAIRARPVGVACLFIVFLFQVPLSAFRILSAIRHVPESRSEDFAGFVKSHPEFQNAWIIADPDYLIEAPHYYLSNPVYLVRQKREGYFPTFSKTAEAHLHLDEILQQAQRLRRDKGQPVLILLAARITSAKEAETVLESYSWTLDIGPGEAQRFLSATHKVASFAPAISDESYDVYSLD